MNLILSLHVLFFWSEWFGRCSTIARPQICTHSKVNLHSFRFFSFSCDDNFFALTLWYEIFNYILCVLVLAALRHSTLQRNKLLLSVNFFFLRWIKWIMWESINSSGHTNGIHEQCSINDKHPMFNRLDISTWYELNHDNVSKVSSLKIFLDKSWTVKSNVNCFIRTKANIFF